ncbi:MULTISPECIES: hypothetical protein [unclassified Rhizobium]|uniref:hypothetical protein n=1 Tax=unclassified Rhizobium TaxID=2613769 RepID=UPI00247925A3|nr:MULTISPECIES: hypothetical protein [unclassified Rhizobium]MDH7801273.1 hypothetical protein [Rhizobium sp. AN70]
MQEASRHQPQSIYLQMIHLLDAIERSLQSSNWEAALIVAVNLPDVCAKLEDIQKQGKVNRYVIWARRWVQPLYTQKKSASRIEQLNRMREDTSLPEDFRRFLKQEVETDDRVFMSAEDLYALRCAFTHGAEHDLSEHNINQTLNSFHITAPSENGLVVHRNYKRHKGPNGEDHSALQVQVDYLCRDICAAVRSWLDENKSNDALNEKISRMPKISPFSSW